MASASRRGLGGVVRSGRIPVGRLLRRGESLVYWLIVAPVVSYLPAGLAYRVACWRGDWTSWYWPGKRAEIVRDLRQVFGDELTLEEAERLAQDLFRLGSCEVIDIMRLRGRARPLRRLVEISGREHLEAALTGGKGVLLCTAHYGSFVSALSVLHASGFPLTNIGRWWWNYETGVSSVERRFWDFVYARRVLRHRQRPSIEPWPGRVQVAVQAAKALSANEIVALSGDAAPLPTEQARAVEVPFLGQQVRLVPGVVGLARLTSAPVLMAFVHRSTDYRHQVLEISPPVPMDGEMATAFGRCVAAMDAAIRTNPAHWYYWFEREVLASLGLVPSTSPNEIVTASGVAASQ